MFDKEQLYEIDKMFEDLSEIQQESVLDLVEQSLSHGDLTEDELMHYGVIGMKWGKRKARQIANKTRTIKRAKMENKLAKIEKKNSKLNDKAAKFEQKALAKERKNAKKMYKLQREELYYDMRGKEARLKSVRREMKKVSIKSAKLRMKSLDAKYKIQKNEKIANKLNKKIDASLMKEAAYIKKYMND